MTHHFPVGNRIVLLHLKQTGFHKTLLSLNSGNFILFRIHVAYISHRTISIQSLITRVQMEICCSISLIMHHFLFHIQIYISEMVHSLIKCFFIENDEMVNTNMHQIFNTAFGFNDSALAISFTHRNLILCINAKSG